MLNRVLAVFGLALVSIPPPREATIENDNNDFDNFGRDIAIANFNADQFLRQLPEHIKIGAADIMVKHMKAALTPQEITSIVRACDNPHYITASNKSSAAAQAAAIEVQDYVMAYLEANLPEGYVNPFDTPYN